MVNTKDKLAANSMEDIQEKRMDKIIIAIAVCLAAFHLFTASVGIMTGYIQAAIHWAFVGTVIVLTNPLKFKGGIVVDVLLVALNIFLAIYQIKIQERLVVEAGIFSEVDYLVSFLSLLLAIEIGRRVLGLVLPTVSVLFVAYAYFGSHIPGMFNTMRFPLQRIAAYLYTATDGLYGQTLLVSAQFIYLFVLFGCILDLTGAGQFFVDLAFAVAGRVRGGPAQAAVYSSMLMGTVNGSGAANVVTTGTFTIPLMKKVGYRPSFAGAVEAVASSGGQIMPPVMGAVAFLMSEITGIAYVDIAIAAIVPAVLYYTTLSMTIYFTACKRDMEKPDISKLPVLGAVMKKGWYYFVPLIIIVVMLVMGYSPQRSVFYAIVSTFAVSILFNPKQLGISKILTAVKNAATGISLVASACMLAGIIMGVINITGLGLKISGIIEQIANGNLIVALVLAMLTSLLLGMGIPTSAAYIVLATLVAPAITAMGVPIMATHLFILYFGALSTITPPVALSIFAAAGISGAGIWETGRDALKLASAGFIVPFIFALNNELLLIGEPLTIVTAVMTALWGCIVLAVSVNGWCLVKISMVGRILLFPCVIMLYIAQPMWVSGAGLVISLIILGLEILAKKSRQPANI